MLRGWWELHMMEVKGMNRYFNYINIQFLRSMPNGGIKYEYVNPFWWTEQETTCKGCELIL